MKFAITTAEMIESFEKIRESVRGFDRPEELVCSQEFFDALRDKGTDSVLRIGPALELPVRVEPWMTGFAAVLRFRSGKMLYLTDKPLDPPRTPEEDKAALEQFMAAPPPKIELLGGLMDLFEDRVPFPGYRPEYYSPKLVDWPRK